MAQSPMLKCVGLYTFENKLSAIPQGSLVDAENIIIDRDGVIESRRGFKIYGNGLGNTAKQLFAYKGRILRHFDSTLEFDSGTVDINNVEVFRAFNGSYSDVDVGTRLKGLEANGNFYFTTSSGIKKISAIDAASFVTTAGYITQAGGIKALDTQADLDYSQIGFLEQDSVVAYSFVWGIKDFNSNLILGSPSGRAVVYNPIEDLLTRDFNLLLYKLDTASSADGGDDLANTDYLSSLKVPFGSTPNTLRTNLLALGDKLDLDLWTVALPASGLTTTNVAVASNVVTLTFSGSVAAIFSIGDVIKVSGLSASADAIAQNGTWTLTGVSGSTVTFAHTYVNFTIADVTGTVVRKIYRKTDPVAFNPIPTSDQLLSIQVFFDNIVNNLLLESTSNIATAAQIAAGFLNSTQSAVTKVTSGIPAGVTTNHFYQVYRTAPVSSSGVSSLSNLDPGNEMGLVFEGNPSSTDISNGFITYQDITPESFRGADLYTNQNQEGIAQANEIPPLARDMALFKGSTFYANTKTRHRKQLSLLGVTKLVNGVSTLSIKDGTTTDTYTFVSPVKERFTVTTVADVANSLNGKYFLINSARDKSSYYVWYKTSGGATSDPALSGKIGIKVNITTADTANTVATKTSAAINAYNDFSIISTIANVITIENIDSGVTTDSSAGTSGFTVTVSVQGAGEDATNKKIVISDASTFAQAADETARSLVRVINKQSSGLIYAYYLSGPDDVPGLLLLESRSLSDVFFYVNVDNATTTGAQFSPMLPISGTTEKSDNEVCPNRIYYSKYQQPEAVPLLNYFDVGPKDKKILRILALRDNLFVLKEDVVYRVSGEGTSSFSTSLFDSSTSLLATDTAAVLNNQIYLFSDQGIATISDTGVSIISRAIEDELRKLSNSTYTNFKTASWAVSYESDRAYIFYTVKNTGDTKAQQGFRYNTFTNSWTSLPNSKTCGVVNPVDSKLYLGAGDTNSIEVERKTFTRQDYADREFQLSIGNNALSGTNLLISSTTNTEIGDVLVQTQYLTINQFNRLLQKLDADLKRSAFPTSYNDYYVTLKALPGDDLRVKLTALATKLDTDTGINQNDFVATIVGIGTALIDCQTAYNLIINKLNIDTTVVDSNYLLSSGSIDFEVRISAVNKSLNKLTLSYTLNLVQGVITLYKHIPCKITWAPQILTDASVLKQAREATILFDNDAFTSAIVSFASDLSPNFDEIPFDGLGTGAWGLGATWGNENWGGEGSGTPFRTLVPLEKQRCRYIQCRVMHGNAFEKFGILGNSYTYELTSSRAYR